MSRERLIREGDGGVDGENVGMVVKIMEFVVRVMGDDFVVIVIEEFDGFIRGGWRFYYIVRGLVFLNLLCFI